VTDAIHLATRVRAMRDAQKAYFAARKRTPHSFCNGELAVARALEKEVDQLAAELLFAAYQDETPSLFAEGGGA
jgi:hypothetical protein